MKRRYFLKHLLALPVILAVEPVIHVTTKMPKLYIINNPSITWNDINAILMDYQPKIKRLLEQDNVFYKTLKSKQNTSFSSVQLTAPLSLREE